MPDIFISYARADRELARKIADRLFEACYDFWIDTQLTPGEIFRDIIRDRIRNARAVIVVWTKHSIISPYVRSEAQEGFSKLIPFRTSDFPETDIPHPFGELHTARVEDWEQILLALSRLQVSPKASKELAVNARVLLATPPQAIPEPTDSLPKPRQSAKNRPWWRHLPLLRPSESSAPGLSEFFAVNAWPRHLVQKRTEFLDYDPAFLRTVYKYENPIAGGNPYTELVNILALATLDRYPRIAINTNSDAFAMSRWNNAGDDLVERAYRKRMGTGAITRPDGKLIRLSGLHASTDGAIVLDVQPARYVDQVRSNLIADFSSGDAQEGSTSIRKLLSEERPYVLPSLSDKRLANTIGVSAILFYRHEGFWTPALWPRAGASNVAVFEGGWHCSASGAAEWSDGVSPTFDNLIVGDMLREIEEELGIDKRQIIVIEPISICREFARLGKPQIFFAGLIDVTFDELTARIRNADTVAKDRGLKREALIHPIFHYPRRVIKRMHRLQARGTDIARLAASFTCDDLFGRRGFTTECVANLYYANLALPFLLAKART